MNVRLRIFVIGLVGLVAVAVYTFPLWSSYLLDAGDAQAFPLAGLPAELQPNFQALPADERAAYIQLNDANPTMALAFVRARLTGESSVPPEEQALPEALGEQPTTVATGEFITINPIRRGSGTVSIYRLPDESYIVRLEDFRVLPGPDLVVILTSHPDPRSGEDVGNFLNLGPLKGTAGSQNYTIPAETTLGDYQSVAIYSQEFGMVFTTAPLGG